MARADLNRPGADDVARRIVADGVFLGRKHTIPAMRNAGSGSIVIVSSVSEIEPSAGASANCSSRTALRLFAKTVAQECAANDCQIRVNTIFPGAVRTPMWEGTGYWEELPVQHESHEDTWEALGAGTTVGRGEPEEIARLISFLASKEASYNTGAELVVDGGIRHLTMAGFPGRTARARAIENRYTGGSPADAGSRNSATAGFARDRVIIRHGRPRGCLCSSSIGALTKCDAY